MKQEKQGFSVKWFSSLATEAADGLMAFSASGDNERELRLWWEGYCDGSYHARAQAIGVGGHLNGPDGELVATFSEAAVFDGILPSGSAHAEYEAAFRILRLAGQRGVRRLIVKMDNRGAVLTLSNQKSANPEMDALAQRVLNEARCFEDVVFQWVPRLKNRMADELSREKLRTLGLLGSDISGAPRPPSIKPKAMVDPGLPHRLGERHPGVFHMDRSRALARGAGEKAKADAQWSGALYFRTHAAHGEGGKGVAAGAEIHGEGKGPSAAIYSEMRHSPALCEVKLMLRLLNKAKESGHRRVLIETTSQLLSLVCSGLREPAPHLRSAVYTLFKKAGEFEKIAVRHRAAVPHWADQLEREAPNLSGFRSFAQGFESGAVCELTTSIILSEGRRLLAIGARVDGAALAFQLRSLPWHESDATCEARWIAQTVRRLADLGVSKVRVASQSGISGSDEPQEPSAKSAWAQLRRGCERAQCSFGSISEQQQKDLKERAEQALAVKDARSDRSTDKRARAGI